MRLLLITQVIDKHDPGLGFFCEWISELAPRFESIEAVCLYEGEHDLPVNVRVHSLGKEKGRVSGLVYALRFKVLAWKLRHSYDAVFVHMNQEYVLIAGPLWKLLGKPVHMWRNHYAGSFLTDIAAAFCTRIFCTSRHSYTAKFKKTVLMPVGVDLGRFSPGLPEARNKGSILFLARMAPSKDPLLLLEALKQLADQGVPFTATFVGSPLPEHEAYYDSVVERVGRYHLSGRVSFLPGVSKEAAAPLYRSHEIFVNCSPSGMLDKTIFEAAASGAVVLAKSGDYGALVGEAYGFASAAELAELLARYLLMPDLAETARPLKEAAQAQGLAILGERLAAAITNV
ncbi:MAG TPA: glycosyltransferase [Candidatus Paceibacterota bacterium]|jgi:glycosyltransferase involved in cell wall biosynthesis